MGYASGATLTEVEQDYPDMRVETLLLLPEPNGDREDLDALLAAASEHLRTVLHGIHGKTIAGVAYPAMPPFVPRLSDSPNRVVVDLPADLRPASYLLTIRNKRDRSNADFFNLQIPAARKDSASLASDE